jgi:subtilisin family serine protease
MLNDVNEDNNSHRTHCAGAIALQVHGVSKAVNIITVKVLVSNGSRSMADVVECVV